MIAGGAEVAALGRVLGQAAAAAVPSTVGGPADVGRRSAVYSDFHRYALGVQAWAEYMAAVQQSVSPPWRAAIAAASAVVPAETCDETTAFGRVGLAFKPLALAMLAGQVVEQLDYQHEVRRELATIREYAVGMLSAYADLRVFGGEAPLVAADKVTAVIGELLSVLPVAKEGLVRRSVSPSDRYIDARAAVGHYLREFDAEARADLARWRWRRRPRRFWWQLHRPRARPITMTTLDSTALIATATEELAK